MQDTIGITLSTGAVAYREGGDVFEAFVAHDERPAAPRPCVLVCHEWSGLSDPMRGIARRLAGLGYVGFALDVYGKGTRGDVLGDNSSLMDPLMADRDLLRRRLLAGYAAAAAHPGVDPGRMAVIGYCFGGLCALDLARAGAPGLKGAASFHGALSPPGLGPQRPIGSSVLLLHGWEDPMATQGDLLAFAAEMTAAEADWQVHAYGHARHAFTFEAADMPERGILYDEKAAGRSWRAMLLFLEEVLGGAPSV